MGVRKEPPNVKRFVTALSADESLFRDIAEPLARRFGKVKCVTTPRRWDFSPAYTRELGRNIQRCFFVLDELVSREGLPDWKIATNELEAAICVRTQRVSRSINLDPGYLDGSQVIMASTKRYGNRIYLRDGIYADFTLYFDGASFAPHRLTLPDYRTRAAIRFFNQLRIDYLSQLAKSGATTHAQASDRSVAT